MAKVTQAVAGKAREKLPGQAYGTKFLRMKTITEKFKVVFDEGVVEVYIVGHKNIPLQQGKYFLRHLLECRRTGHHLIGDAGKTLDIPGNGLVRVDQCFKPFRYFFPVKYLDAYFNDAIGGSISACGLYVNNGIHPFPTFEM